MKQHCTQFPEKSGTSRGLLKFWNLSVIGWVRSIWFSSRNFVELCSAFRKFKVSLFIYRHRDVSKVSECLAEWRAPEFNTQVEFQPNGCRWESFYSLFLLLPLRIVNPRSCLVLIFPTFPIKCDATNSARLAVLFYWKYFFSCWGLYMM